MKYCVLLFLLTGCPLLKSQNLVPNPSFEDYKVLPCDIGVSFVQDFLKNWFQPIPTTTDYWNSLSNFDCYFNPSHVNELPRTGQGMMGIITAEIEVGFKTEYKEYLEIELSTKLKKGNFYNLEFYAKHRMKNPSPINSFRSNNLGAALSDSLIFYPISTNPPDHLLLRPAIKENNIVNSLWQKIGGCFTANSSSQYLLIGNFDSIDSTRLVQLNSGNDVGYAYYFIDDVLLEELPYDISGLANAILCSNQASVELNAFVEGATGYNWEDGTNSSVLKVSATSTKEYTVDIHFNECTYKHKFHVEPIPDVALGADTTLCTGEVLKLNPTHPINEYQWSDGSTDSVKYISEAGIYSVVVPSDDCTIQDSIAVEFIDCPGFIPNIITPNEDNHNEYFVFENIENRIWSLLVFNRWGEQVYFSEHYKNDWRGEGLSEGIYYYKLLSKTLRKEVKGWVHVFR